MFKAYKMWNYVINYYNIKRSYIHIYDIYIYTYIYSDVFSFFGVRCSKQFISYNIKQKTG